MNRCIFAFALVGITTLPAYAQTPDLEATRATLRQLNVDYCQLIMGRDAARLAATYAPTASMFPPNEATLTGTQGVQTWVNGFMALPALTVRACAPVQVDVSGGGDVGYTLFNYDLSYNGPNGQRIDERGRDVMVWKKQPDGSWKITIDIWNVEPPR